MPVNSVISETAKPRIALTKDKILREYKDVFEGLGHIEDSSSFVVNANHIPARTTRTKVDSGDTMPNIIFIKLVYFRWLVRIL